MYVCGGGEVACTKSNEVTGRSYATPIHFIGGWLVCKRMFSKESNPKGTYSLQPESFAGQRLSPLLSRFA